MQYLVATYDKDYKISFPPGTREFYEMTNWLFFMNSGLGPMQGQSNHFLRYCPEDIPYARDRYRNEARRLYGVLNKHLDDSGAEYLVGNKCTIADIAHWGWIFLGPWAGIDIEEFPTLKKWENRMSQRPGVEKGRNVPDVDKFKEILADPEKMKEMAEKGMKFVQEGMKKDAEKKEK